MRRGGWTDVVLGCLTWLVVGCIAEPEKAPAEDWDGAGIEPICTPETIRITGEVEAEVIDFSVESGFGFSNVPLWWLELFETGVKISLVSDSNRSPVLGQASGVFVLGESEPLYCAAQGTNTSFRDSTSKARLRSLTRPSPCPGSEVVDGVIEGCVGDLDQDCTVSGGPLPAGEVDVVGHSLLRAGPAISLQIEFRGGRVLDLDTERAGSTLLYEGVIYCVGNTELTSDDPDRTEFVLSDITRVGACSEADEVGGYVNACLPF